MLNFYDYLVEKTSYRNTTVFHSCFSFLLRPILENLRELVQFPLAKNYLRNYFSILVKIFVATDKR